MLSVRAWRRTAVAAATLAAVTALVAAIVAVPASSGAASAGNAKKTWPRAARQLTMPVFKPTKTFGMRLGFVNVIRLDPGCVNDGRDQLRAFYGHQAGRFLEVFEGHPRYCLDEGIDAPVLQRPKIHGKKAALHRISARRLALEWCEKGTTITLVAEGLSRKRLLAIGRGMRTVDSAKALPCVSRAARASR